MNIAPSTQLELLTASRDETPELGVALSLPESLEKIGRLKGRPTLGACLSILGAAEIPELQSYAHRPLQRIHLGNEFCERLLPAPRELAHCLSLAERRRLTLCLVTPMLTDAGLRRVERLLPLLPPDCEVVVNDWGTLERLSEQSAPLVPVLGRLLNKMIKDPRLPSRQWTRLHPHQGQSPHFQALLQRLGIERMEMDVPPFADLSQFHTAPLGLGVHLPYGYAVKGRMCRIGSLAQPEGQRFVAAHGCRKECLTYWARLEREGARPEGELQGFQRGNTQFYRHSSAMADVLGQAVERGWVQRLIVAGDWHENHRTA